MERTQTNIPKDEALQLCAEVRERYRGKWWTFAGMQCIGCTTASKGILTKMCVNNAPGYRGCNLVNKFYDRKVKMMHTAK